MTDRLTLALELTADPSKLKAGLEIARRAILEQFQAAKAAVDGANKSLDEAQSHAQAMAQALRADGVEAQSFAAWMKGAAAAVREAKAAVQEKTLALQQARTAAQENAAAIEGATLAEWKAATAANFSAQLAAAQRLITAEETLRREVLATVAASGRNPPVMPLDRHTMSGVKPTCSRANMLPVRPKPVMTSSKMSTVPCFAVISRR